ncbi:MAG: hypothetical protein RSD93_05610 [Gordonibacter sp.]|uniref:hypothetical protein n=1 Tax=Gordonibacter sp. TaxID=1968902 RepID=UPI002FC5CE44
MDYQELKDCIDGLAPTQRQALGKVLSLAALGGALKPEFQAHAEAADSPRAFFEAIYADDDLRFTNVWAAWAKHAGKDWLGRFEPIGRGARVDFRGRESQDAAFSVRGVPVAFAGGGSLIVPLSGRGADVYLFADDSFNEEAATYFTTLQGDFTCAGLELSGMFDVFKADNALILEQWNLGENGFRARTTDLANTHGFISMH